MFTRYPGYRDIEKQDWDSPEIVEDLSGWGPCFKATRPFYASEVICEYCS